MKRLMFACLLVSTALPACAAESTTSLEHPAAQHAYVAAQHQFAERAYPKSIALLRHAASTLPTGTSYDQARHDLVMRIAYVQIYAFEATGDVGYLHDAALMLDRYAARPESRRTAANHRDTSAMSAMVRERLDAPALRDAVVRSEPHDRYPSDAADHALLVRGPVRFTRNPALHNQRTDASEIGTPPVGRYGRSMVPSYSASDAFRASLMDPY